MYGGLFGDLPAAKKKSGGPSSRGKQHDDVGGVGIGKDEATASTTTIARKSVVQAPNSNASPATTDGTTTSVPSTGQGTSWLFPASRKRPKPNNTAGSDGGMGNSTTATATARGNATTTESNSATSTTTSTIPTATSNTIQRPTGQILKGLGAAGTSMAFVPTATLHKRKRFLPNGTPAPPPTIKSVAPSTTNNNINPSLSPSLDPSAPGTATAGPATSYSQQTQQPPDSNGATAMSTATTTTTTGISWISSDLVVTCQDDANSYHPSSNGAADNTANDDEKYDNASDYEDDDDDEVYVEDIEDPYDPFVPNDLLQYWERKALAQERLDLEREAKEAIEQQERMRREVERQREELRQKGDYQQLLLQNHHPPLQGGTGTGGGDMGGGVFGYGGGFSTTTSAGAAMGGGRGRGRGVSNLPAWLVEKQRMEREQQLGANVDAGGVGTNAKTDNTSNNNN
jgi:hypothetical protein